MFRRRALAALFALSSLSELPAAAQSLVPFQMPDSPKETIEIQPGMQVPVTLALKRLHGFTGPITVELVPPGGGTGLSATPVTVAPKATEAKLTMRP